MKEEPYLDPPIQSYFNHIPKVPIYLTSLKHPSITPPNLDTEHRCWKAVDWLAP
jgi:hypothetical protein